MGPRAELVAPDLLVALAEVPDPRKARRVRHRLVTVLATAVCAVLAGHAPTWRSRNRLVQYLPDHPIADNAEPDPVAVARYSTSAHNPRGAALLK